MEDNVGCAGFFCGHFDVLPTDAAAPTSLQSFQCRFFCGEAGGIMLRGRRAPRFAVRTLGVSEDALSKARRARDGFSDAPHFDNIDADGNDHRRGRC